MDTKVPQSGLVQETVMNESATYRITDDLLFGSSEVMQHLRRQVDNIADTGLPVLIQGESGTGKEALAWAIHARSSRRSRAFIKISCSAAIPFPPLERIVFGDNPITPTSEGASAQELIERERVGTVVFDDIGELDLSVQPKLISLLQDSHVSGIGAGGVQVVCTTKTSLLPMLESGSFRDDLYYRINVVNLFLPPLRDRRIDIPVLAFHFLKLYGEAYQRSPGPFSQHLIDLFLAADWPGNIRELENAVKRYIVMGCAESLIADLQKHLNTTVMDGTSGELSLKALRRNAVRDCEYRVILTSLNRNNWNRRKTAHELHISYRSLLYTMEQLGFPKKRALATVGASPPSPSCEL